MLKITAQKKSHWFRANLLSKYGQPAAEINCWFSARAYRRWTGNFRFLLKKTLNYQTKDKLNDVLRRNRKLNESENGRLERLSRTLSSKSSKRSRSVNFTADLDKCCVDRVQGSKFEFFSCWTPESHVCQMDFRFMTNFFLEKCPYCGKLTCGDCKNQPKSKSSVKLWVEVTVDLRLKSDSDLFTLIIEACNSNAKCMEYQIKKSKETQSLFVLSKLPARLYRARKKIRGLYNWKACGYLEERFVPLARHSKPISRA